MKKSICLAAASLLAACTAQSNVQTAAATTESCAEMAQRMAPFNPQTAESIERECLRDRAQ